MTGRIWRAALYVRLSKEDGRSESLSIQNQIACLRQYVEKQPDLLESGVYADDGISGVHMDRPAFRQMQLDLEQGRVDCVLVKDLSRLSRNYIEAGQYLEEWFVQHQVRFISLELPFYDSLQEPWGMQSVLVPLQNIINDDFCRQTSLKIRSVLRSKEQQGLFIGAFAPYGYKKSPSDGHRLEVDEEAAEVVRWLFYEYGVGQKTMAALAAELNEAHIPSPSAYKRQQGLPFVSPAASQAEGKWTAGTIGHLLHQPVYCGHMVQGKTRRKSYKVRSQMRLPQKEWIWVAHTHPAIVEAQLFELVQQKHARCSAEKQGREHLLGGLVFCGLCGRKMTTKSARGKGYFVCPARRNGLCDGQTAAEDWMEEAVIEQVKTLEEACPKERSKPQLQRQEQLLDTIYWEYVTGALSKEQYLRLKERWERTQEETKVAREPSFERMQLAEAVEKIVVLEEEIQVYLRLPPPAGAQNK